MASDASFIIEFNIIHMIIAIIALMYSAMAFDQASTQYNNLTTFAFFQNVLHGSFEGKVEWRCICFISLHWAFSSMLANSECM
jgi:hypothetical protein